MLGIRPQLYGLFRNDFTRAAAHLVMERAPGLWDELVPAINWLAFRLTPIHVASSPAGLKPRLLVDVSSAARTDWTSGVQRVVCALLSSLLRQRAQLPFEPVPIRLTFSTEIKILEARSFLGRLVGQEMEDVPLSVSYKDIVLMLDASWDVYPLFARGLFPIIRSLDGQIVTCAYDIIPVTHPHFFERRVQRMYARWFDQAIRESDLIVSISDATRAAVAARVNKIRPDLPLAYFHLGADFNTAPPGPNPFIGGSTGPVILMVGTIEPRKGYVTALDAMEVLWRRGSNARLAIIGRPGWLMDDFLQRLEHHPERGRKLILFERADDATVNAAYAHCDALLAASVVEGFGLPLIEAARFSKPLIVSDIPVFREICGDKARYFTPDKARSLIDALTLFFNEDRCNRQPIIWATWEQSSRALVATICEHLSGQTSDELGFIRGKK